MSKVLRSYTFRAEFEKDVNLFLAAIRKWLWEVDIRKQFLTDDDGTTFPIPDRDVVMKLKGNLNLTNLRWIADQIEDCHVIAETIEASKKYTGDRTYNMRKATEAPGRIDRQHIMDNFENCIDFFESEIERAKAAMVGIEEVNAFEVRHPRTKVKVVPAIQQKQSGTSRQAS